MEQKLKKLGVGNSKDRARMMGSLATFRKDPPPHRKSMYVVWLIVSLCGGSMGGHLIVSLCGGYMYVR